MLLVMTQLIEESPSKEQSDAKTGLSPKSESRKSFVVSPVATNKRRSSILIRRESISDYSRNSLASNRRSSVLPVIDDSQAESPEQKLPSQKRSSSGRVSLTEIEEFETPDEDDTTTNLAAHLDTIAEDEAPCSPEQAEAEAEAEVDTTQAQNRLLHECRQPVGAVPTMEAFLTDQFNLDHNVRKIGEGTFGEAFKIGNQVLKVVPIDGSVPVNGEKQKSSEELYAEVAIHNALRKLREDTDADNACATFIETYAMRVCRGRYPQLLVEEWEKWDERCGSENDHVGIFPEDQLYTIFVYSDGGCDLEQFTFASFDEVRSMLLQVCLGLAVAEEACKFEHRDLHWGNLLLKRGGTMKRCSTTGVSTEYTLRGVDILAETGGLDVQIIDFTLSRLETSGGFVAFCDLAEDPELFQGPKHDAQAETYRRMNKATRGAWASFAPRTNVWWIYYLATMIIDHKIDAFTCTSQQKHDLKSFRKSIMKYENASDVVWDEFFKDTWRVL